MKPWITEPGVYDLPGDVYHSDPIVGGSLSSSGAKLLLPPSAPAKFDHYRRNGRPDTKAFDLGHAAHAELLGTGAPIEVIVGTGKDPNAWNTNATKEAVDRARTAGRIPVKPDDAEQVAAMVRAVREHEDAAALLDRESGRAEQTLVARDRRTGVMRRAMLDWLPDIVRGQRLILVDYKTAESSEPRAMCRSMSKYGYHQQAAWNLDLVRDVLDTGDVEPAFVFIFQEKTEPYLVTIGQVSPEAMLWGRRLNRKALDIYAQCTASGHWPGYADSPVSLDLPPYAVRQLEDAWEAGEFDTDDDKESAA